MPEYMLVTFWLWILFTYSPWVTAGFGEISREAKGLVGRAGEECQREG